MKKQEQFHQQHDNNIEILKAVAQAWHGHSSSSKASSTTTTTSEFDAHRRFFKGKPTRFKIEAMTVSTRNDQCGTSWDFGQSLWDSYEIVSVSKKLETGLGLGLDDPFSQENGVKRRKESKNSLRSLFNRMSSKRFTEEDLPSDEESN